MVDIGISNIPGHTREDRASSGVLANGYHYAGVFDGHNGSGAAEWCADNFVSLLNHQFYKGATVRKALSSAFRAAHESIPGVSGTTASVVVTQGNYAAVAHVGDSRVMMCHGDTPTVLTEDHKLSWQPELKRITEAQAKLGRNIILGRRVEGLMLTRSIGDKSLTDAIIPDPVITDFVLTEDNDYVVLATDGLWDVCSAEEVCQAIRSRRANAEDSSTVTALELADELVYKAKKAYKSRRDDITCCVMHFDKPKPQ